MKQIKNVVLILICGVLILSIATMSCQKVDNPTIPPTDTTHSIPPIPTITITNVSPNPVFTGDTVTITGTNFSSPATVTINGGTAIIGAVSANGTTIVFVAPAATSGTLIGASNGQTVIYNNFVVNAKPSVGQTSDSIAPGNLIAHWTFDGNSTEAISGLSAILTAGTVSYSGAGQIGNCATFTNGALAYNPISAINNSTALESYSISMWVDMPSATGEDPIRPLFQITGTKFPDIWGEIAFELTNYGATGDTLALGTRQVQMDGISPYEHMGTTQVNYGNSTNKWTFITETYNGTGNNQTMSIYANGTLLNSQELNTVTKPEAFNIVPTGYYPTDGIIPANKVYIGTFAFFNQGNTQGDGYGNFAPIWSAGNYAWASEGITGKLDDIRLYNKALTATEIASLYYAGSQGK
jgi:hypothetical protein